MGNAEDGLSIGVLEFLALPTMLRSIAIPSLGCGNGGLDWAQVKPMIIKAFAEVPHVRALVFEPIDTLVSDKI